jgi:hypothetical protein
MIEIIGFIFGIGLLIWLIAIAVLIIFVKIFENL